MSDAKPLMPKATAVWLVENTALTFEQIGEFCGLHVLEIKGIADGDVAQGIRGKDPITGGELSREEILRGEKNPNHKLKLQQSKVVLPQTKAKKPARYTPTTRRQDRPNAIQWLVKNHPELKDPQIVKLVGTTKPTIQQIRDRSHWNSQNLVPQDPVTLGLCSQIDLDREVLKAAQRVRKELEDNAPALGIGGTLASTAETTGYVPGLGPQPDIGIGPVHASRNEVEEEPVVSERTQNERALESLRRMSSGVRRDEEEQPDLAEIFGGGGVARDEDEDDGDGEPEAQSTRSQPRTSDEDDVEDDGEDGVEDEGGEDDDGGDSDDAEADEADGDEADAEDASDDTDDDR